MGGGGGSPRARAALPRSEAVAGASIGSSSQPVGPHVDKHSGVVNSNRENNFTGSAEARPSSGKDDCEGEGEERDGDWLAAKGDVFGESGLQIIHFRLLIFPTIQHTTRLSTARLIFERHLVLGKIGFRMRV